MRRKLLPSRALSIATCLVGPVAILQAAAIPVVVKPVGTPAFAVTDFHQLSAPTGPDPDQVDRVIESLTPLHYTMPYTRHSPPYATEFAQGVAANGYVDKTVFDTSEFSGNNGVYFAFMLVPPPNASTGSSRNFASGPVILRGSFSIAETINVLHNGLPFEDAVMLAFPIPSDSGPSDDVSHRRRDR
jgi:hypothetical protein